MIFLMRNKISYPSFYRTDEELKLIWICSIFYFLIKIRAFIVPMRNKKSDQHKNPLIFQRVLSSTQRLAIRRFFFLIGLFLFSRSDALSGCLEMLRMAAE